MKPRFKILEALPTEGPVRLFRVHDRESEREV